MYPSGADCWSCGDYPSRSGLSDLTARAGLFRLGLAVTGEKTMKHIALLALVASLAASTAQAQASDSIVSEGIVNAPPSAVWGAWTTASGLKSWLAPHAEIDLRIDGLMRTNYDAKGTLGDAGTIENRILAFERDRMLAIRVAKAPENFPFKSRIGDMWTVLYFEPAPDGKTLLRVVGLGFASDEESQKMKSFFAQGNAYTLTQIQKRFQQ
ncbi:MAG: SRPBCC domain-containing protein [Casimicrobiaceae bacterium]